MPIYPLPNNLSPILNDINVRVSNPVLAFNYFVKWQKKWTPAKDDSLRQAENAGNGIAPYASHYQKRLEEQLKSLEAQGYKTGCFSLKTESRLIVGLGAKGALEVGITLHHLYGFPYIPSSAVKGICRAFAEQIADAQDDEKKQIFGSKSKDEKQDSEKQLGGVVFLDAVPNAPRLEKDIMNPHYSPYYSEQKTPGDWHSPIPIFFLAVPAGTEFWFGLAADSEEHLKKAKEWLIGGLSELGAGAKTSSGYGFFEIEKVKKDTVHQAEAQLEPNTDVEAEQPENRQPNPKPKGAVEAVIEEFSSEKIKVKITEGNFKDRIEDLKGTNFERLKNLQVQKGDEVYVTISSQGGKIQSVSFNLMKYRK